MDASRVTHDRQRLRLWETLRGEVGCVLQRGPSFTWLSQAIAASKRGRRRLGGLSVSIWEACDCGAMCAGRELEQGREYSLLSGVGQARWCHFSIDGSIFVVD